MSASSQIVAFFDLEGTLCQAGGVLWREVTKWQVNHCGAVRVAVHLSFQLLLSLLHRLRLIRRQRVQVIVTKDMASILNSVDEDDLSQLAESISEKLHPRFRPDMQRILREHIEHGHRVVLISGMLQPFLERVGRKVSADLCIGTALEKQGRYYTGQLCGPVCMGEEKAFLLRKRISEAGVKVDFGQSYAYGDTIWDRPLLELVGNPVAVYPDKELRAYAEGHDWRIIE